MVWFKDAIFGSLNLTCELGTEQSISLYRWWPGGKSRFNIKNPGQWEAIKASIRRLTKLIKAIKQDGTDNIRQLDEALSNWSLTQVAAVDRETQR